MAIHLVRGLSTLALVFPRATPARRDRLIRAWGRKVLAIFSVRLVVDPPPGLDLAARRRLYVGNHVSWLDIYALQSVTAARFVAKAELATWPLIGRLIRQSGTVFIERSKRSDTRRINQTLRAHLEAGDVIAVFPEGTTSDGRDVRKFHANLLQAALDADAEIVPFCLRYLDTQGNYAEAPAYIGDLTFLQSVARVLRERRLVCELTFFPPLERAGRGRRELAAAAEQQVRLRLHGHSRQDR
ncbi:MAG: 1-acyl-sn-glycerol-3-phosphate acyltransferase [Burkholderiales bacterium]|nr:1-acyl-sn-glycerol-3-phosphate acyltransferase [Burkholderiales bacterium]